MHFDEQTYYKTLEETFRANHDVKPLHIDLVKLIKKGGGEVRRLCALQRQFRQGALREH